MSASHNEDTAFLSGIITGVVGTVVIVTLLFAIGVFSSKDRAVFQGRCQQLGGHVQGRDGDLCLKGDLVILRRGK